MTARRLALSSRARKSLPFTEPADPAPVASALGGRLLAVAANKPIAVITPEARVLRAMTRFAPGLGRRFARVDLNRF